MINHVFLAIAGVLVAAAITWPICHVLLWPAAILVAAWVVYLFDAPRAFGKRGDGTLPWYAWAVWWPVFVFQWVGHELARSVTSEPVANEVAPGVWVGRRPRENELPAGIAIVVDLCAEMPAARDVSNGREYMTVPTLDARTPTLRELAAIVDRVQAAGGPAFIHCAFGHGRSATVAAAVLVRRGDYTLATVEAAMKAVRPRIGLNRRQRAALAAASAGRDVG
ncbi:MAG: dual specificity protein phosphatase family protein [Deltaproteobacteria bacterium]